MIMVSSLRSLAVGGALMACLSTLAQASTDQGPDTTPILVPPKISSSWFDLPVDHFNDSDTRTFPNRYWYNATYYKAGGPVFLYDAGESGVTDDQAAVDIATDGSPTIEMARQFSGIAVTWEHRFFGESQPFYLDLQTLALPGGANQAYPYLTIEQALEDVVYFANNFDVTGIDSGSLHPSKTPWIFIGGSYPGSRAAWARVRNPEVFYASWASSAPVNPLADGSAYFNPISRSIPTNCTNDISAVLQYVDDALQGSDGQLKSSIQQRLYTAYVRTTDGQNNTIDYTEAMETSNRDFGNDLYRILGNFQDVGPARENGGTLQSFCDDMESWDPEDNPDNPFMTTVYNNTDDRTPTSAGLADQFGPDEALNAFLFAFAQALTGTLTTNEPQKPYPIDDASWAYLVATDFGVLQGTSPSYYETQTRGSSPIISRFRDQADLWNMTVSALPNVTVPDGPDPGPVVDRYGGWHMNPSHVMFTSGQWDPWRAYTVMSLEDTLGAPVRNASEDIPACGRPPSPDLYFGVTYGGAVHCADLKSSARSPESRHSQELFAQALKVWLPCFNATSGDGGN